MRAPLLAALVFSAAALAACAQVSDQQIVKNAFPANLNDGDGAQFSRYILADLNRDGRPLIVAVYTNLAGGAIRVLDRSGEVLAAPALPGMRGFHGSVKAVDLDGDGTPEIIAEFTTGHSPDNPDTWVFRWTGSALEAISPTCKVGTLTLTCLGHVSLLDQNGDGKLALLDWPAFTFAGGAVTATGPWTLYTLNNGTFQPAEKFAFARAFSRSTDEPSVSDRQFTSSAGAATLRLVNGTGDAAATSGHVVLNGTEVFGPDDFKRGQHAMNATVSLASRNTLEVRLEGRPGATITVLIGQPLLAATPSP